MVEQKSYVPRRGDVVWLNFERQSGREHRSVGLAVVLSPEIYNGKTGLALLCPITLDVKGNPFEVRLPVDYPHSGVILADQIKSLDWRARNAQRSCVLPADVMEELFAKLKTLFPF